MYSFKTYPTVRLLSPNQEGLPTVCGLRRRSYSIAFFSRALFRNSSSYAINVQRTGQGLSFHSLSALSKISNGEFVFGHLKSIWTYVGLVDGIAFILQTAAFTAALTPSPINLSYNITGQELDMTSPTFLDTLEVPSFEFGIQSATQIDTKNKVLPWFISSGVTGSMSNLSLPSFFSFNDYSYVDMINGVLPANLDIMSNILPRKDAPYIFLPASARLEQEPKYHGLKTSYTMTQQGYQPNVICRPENTRIHIENVQVNNQNHSQAALNASIQCDDGTQSTMSMPSYRDQNAILMTVRAARQSGTDPSDEYDIFITGHGDLYDPYPDYWCHVNSDVVVLDVHYGDTTTFNSAALNLMNGISMAQRRISMPRMGLEASSLLMRQIMYSQNQHVNSVGNIIYSFYSMNYDPTPVIGRYMG
ncbi:hypothetical protein AMATHDRAFT_42563 [Amanita thiersii Skay4041]|uniref:Uncharacterized protein n=1 Tax=Amanita thiersii Skay4041 TaxID=703135 RepID=A0A2A9NJW5_9AGAR|nr:hypothetical protein AMATHDRAFT_42563 [Amanita thiersii Skay4041]